MINSGEVDTIIASSRRWVENVVVELNLCPFAGRELRQQRIRFAVSPATTEEQLLSSLQTELDSLDANPEVETTLLIHPRVLHDFGDYNQFLETVDGMLEVMGVDGVYQVASFHPQYQFADTAIDDVENYTNRSPHPMLHLLREESLERAIDSYPDTDQIPLRNIALMKRLGLPHLQQLLRNCSP